MQPAMCGKQALIDYMVRAASASLVTKPVRFRAVLSITSSVEWPSVDSMSRMLKNWSVRMRNWYRKIEEKLFEFNKTFI